MGPYKLTLNIKTPMPFCAHLDRNSHATRYAIYGSENFCKRNL